MCLFSSVCVSVHLLHMYIFLCNAARQVLSTICTSFSIVHSADNYLPRVVDDLTVCTFLDRCRSTTRHLSKYVPNGCQQMKVTFNWCYLMVPEYRYTVLFFFHLVSGMFVYLCWCIIHDNNNNTHAQVTLIQLGTEHNYCLLF